MERITTTIPQADIDRQLSFCREIAQINAARPQQPLAFVDTYGCQQNEADSERIRGYLRQMGYGFTDQEEEAQIIVLNTCAIREHAEQRVLGNLGALVHVKRRHPDQIICVCGCMAQEQHVADKIKQSFRHVDLVFGPHVLWKFPEFIHTLLTSRGRIFQIPDEAGSIAEGIPVVRQDKVKAWVSIMYGCNNFCSYCIVPYVRGRERSRKPEDILNEVRELVAEGLVCSFKGAKGGYTLAKSPEEITLRQVIELVEGPYMLSRCQKEEYSCGREHCRLHSIYEKISEDVRRELESYTFAMICAPKPCSCCGEEAGT